MSTQGNTGKQDAEKIKSAALKRAADLVKSDTSKGNFFTRVISAFDPQDLAIYSEQQIDRLLSHSYSQLSKYSQNDHLIHIWQPEPDNPDAAQIIDIFLANIPFVVDSVLAAIRARGGVIRLFVHPSLPLDTQQKSLGVLAKADKNSQSVSFLQVHIDPVVNEVSLAELYTEIDSTLLEVRRTVRGWRPMLERLRTLIQSYRQNPPDISSPIMAETLHFLAWLADHNFTFLGMREYSLSGTGDKAHLTPIKDGGLGILEDPNYYFLRKGAEYVEMTGQHTVFLQKSDPIMVTKANIQSRVHRRAHMDYIGVKLYDTEGNLNGELRIIGLFTSMSLATPHTEVPFIRRKVSEVMRRSKLEPGSHAGKALMAALENYPREELFQIEEKQLFEFATLIAALPDRPRVRVLSRIDQFDNFVSVLLYLPRDRYDSKVRHNIGEYLAEQYDGRISAYYPHFPEGEMVRVHYIIGRNGGKTPRPDRIDLETDITELMRSFGDRILSAATNPGKIAPYANAFPPGYQSANTYMEALADITVLQTLAQNSDIAVRLAKNETDRGGLTLKVYHAQVPIPLSDRVPLLENFGFKVIDEHSFKIRPENAGIAYIHDMHVELEEFMDADINAISERLERAIKAIWAQKAESDGLNTLAISANLEWDDIGIVRAMVRYMRQLGTNYSQRYIWAALNVQGPLVAKLIELFHVLHNPEFSGDREKTAKNIQQDVSLALEKITSIDEDRIVRHLLNLIRFSLRTNFFQRNDDGSRRSALAIKFDSPNIEGMPAPRPYREISVYSPRIEGIHLRGGPIARGGLRWSDRPEDFRTEVLGLVKAQMTKNSVIVPTGSKGGFFPKNMPQNPDRETFLAEGIACYKVFINALLDVTDNLDGETIIPPKNMVRRDGDDPYLVVAADKGTATFSDTANAISEAHHFWLGDAFASGGSAGYDHKVMGITARGAWEAVKRHFRELNRDIQTSPVSVCGVGDMSGDVFGNGMLLSKEIRLIAAFDHRDIFIDPDPDAPTSFAERQRVFDLPRSSWQDYNQNLISKGGGIFPRSSKSISLSKEARAVLDLSGEKHTPNQIMHAILKAKTDLLWFGGIGTYVRAKSESNADADDKANDAIRVTATQVGAKCIGEGANLGITQLARIEFAQNGGLIDTDAIHNSAGVNSSDLEVNIKIALGTLVRDKVMNLAERNEFLAQMTNEVAELCLRNNYLQTLALSITQFKGMDETADLFELMQAMDSDGELDREVEFLPDDIEVLERLNARQPITRPETAILLAYAKNILQVDLINSDVVDDPYLAKELYRYFPAQLTGQQPQTIENHRLRREVIATVLSNAMINRGGPAYIHKMTSATSADAAQVAYAYAAARDSFALTELNAAIDDLDNKVTGAVQLSLYSEVQTLLVSQTLWFLRNVSFEPGLSAIVQRYAGGIDQVQKSLSVLLPPFIEKSIAEQAKGFEEGGTPKTVARQIAELSALTLATDIVLLAEQSGVDVKLAAKGYFAVLERFRLGRITELSRHVQTTDHYDRMALDRALANVMRAQRDLSNEVLAAGKGDIEQRMKAWDEALSGEISRIEKMVTDLTDGELTVSRLSVAAGLLSDLARH